MLTFLVAVACALIAAWSQSMPSYPSGPNVALQSLPAQTSIVARGSVAAGGGSPAQWRARRLWGGESLIDIHFTSPTEGWIASYQGSFYKTADGGDTWQQVKVAMPAGSHVTSAHFADSRLGWVTAVKDGSYYPERSLSESWLLHTNDGGQTWSVQYAGKDLGLNRVVFVGDREGWAVGTKWAQGEESHNDPLVLYTTDQGRQWTEVPGDLGRLSRGGDITTIHSPGPNQATVFTNAREVFDTSDGGMTWRREAELQEPPQIAVRRVVAADKSLWVLGGADSREGMWTMLARIGKDGPRTKFTVNEVNLQDMDFLPGAEVVACGSVSSGREPDDLLARQGVILRSRDAGRNWTVAYRNAEIRSINALAVVDATRILAVGDGGLILTLEPHAEKEFTSSRK